MSDVDPTQRPDRRSYGGNVDRFRSGGQEHAYPTHFGDEFRVNTPEQKFVPHLSNNELWRVTGRGGRQGVVKRINTELVISSVPKREVEIQARSGSRHVVPIWDYDLSGQWAWIVTPLLPRSLAQVLDYAACTGQRLTALAVRKIGRDVLAGLAWAYSQGARAHRDLNPPNVFLSLPPTVDTDDDQAVFEAVCRGDFDSLVGDFGAAAVTRLTTPLRQSPEGKRWYMAPEALLGRGDPASSQDTFSLGVTLLEAATGLQPGYAGGHGTFNPHDPTPALVEAVDDNRDAGLQLAIAGALVENAALRVDQATMLALLDSPPGQLRDLLRATVGGPG